MHDAEGRVAVLNVFNYYPYGKEVVYLIQRLFLVDHLFVDGEEMLCPAVHLGLYPCLFYRLLYLSFKGVDIGVSLHLLSGDCFNESIISLRLKVFEGKVIKLHLHF